jgi:GntR family transcriptional regulator/MocR family aminotransferase
MCCVSRVPSFFNRGARQQLALHLIAARRRQQKSGRLSPGAWADIIGAPAMRQGQKSQQWLGQMTRASVREDLLQVRLDRRLATPLFRQVYQRVRDAILDGTLRPGVALPSSRSLAAQLSTARGTVESAYALLAGEGYIVGRTASGTVVNPGLRHLPAPGAAEELRPNLAKLRSASDRTAPARPFQMGLPALDAFPRKAWARLVARRARSFSESAMVSQEPAGYVPLRQAIAGYLAIARGIRCSPAQIFITAGYQGALGLITRTLLAPGEAVWFENPGYFRARDALAKAGATIVPVPVDRDGLDTSVAIRSFARARLAVVTPAHQCPLGVTLSLRRRLELLAWAAETGAWIVEDDYDSEFRYHGRPLPALKSLDEEDRVFYAGSFSKVLSPGLRLGYLVVPSSELDRFSRDAELFAPMSSLLDQMVVADFMTDGTFARHLERMRRLYGERRRALVSALHEVFGSSLALDVPSGGMHVIGRIPGCRDDVALAACAQRAGLRPFPLSSCSFGRRVDLGLLLSFTNIPAELAEREARRLHQAIAGHLPDGLRDRRVPHSGQKADKRPAND